MEFSVTQKERLANLGADPSRVFVEFNDVAERDAAYGMMERQLSKEHREGIADLLDNKRLPAAARVAVDLERWLIEAEGFTKVTTPTIIPASMLDKMTISEDSPLRDQVFFVEDGRCLRPMLAPGLYEVMRELKRITGKTVKIFEAGSCFRKDSQGSKHLAEFTMLNMVELGGVRDGGQMARLKSLASSAMEAVGINDYRLINEDSAVYGETLDIVCGEIEVASASFGPHRLDDAWGIFDVWTGIGFGIERLAMVREGKNSIKQVGRSTSFLDGWSLKV